MKKYLSLLLAGALALTVTSCDDDKKDDDGGFSGKIAINGQIETVNTAFYHDTAANDRNEAYFQLMLLRDFFTQTPENNPDFFITIAVSESLCGKTIDLTQPIVKSGALNPGINLLARNAPAPRFWISYTSDGKIEVVNSVSGPIDATVTAGTLTATRSGENFTVRLSVTLSDGYSIAAEWKGTATKVMLE